MLSDLKTTNGRDRSGSLSYTDEMQRVDLNIVDTNQYLFAGICLCSLIFNLIYTEVDIRLT